MISKCEQICGLEELLMISQFVESSSDFKSKEKFFIVLQTYLEKNFMQMSADEIQEVLGILDAQQKLLKSK